MAKVCECCRKKVNTFWDDILYIGDIAESKVLCSKCVRPISDDLNNIFRWNITAEEFNTLELSIEEKSKKLFSENVVKGILQNVLERKRDMGFQNCDDKTDVVENSSTEKNTEVVEHSNVKSTNTENNTVSSGMFSNIGSKIKTLAKVVTWIGIIASVISGVAMMATGADMFVFVGIVVAILGSLLSWVSSFVLYGFGQLIENTDELVRSSKK